jgi:DNA polymerase-3 subunit chi
VIKTFIFSIVDSYIGNHMTRVDFYLLSEAHEEGKWLFVCRLCEKAYQKKCKIYIFMASQDEVKHLDNLLWSFRDDAFLPHEVAHDNDKSTSPVQIGTLNPPAGFDFLINLTSSVPAFFSQFSRSVEIVLNDESALEKARDHFRFYRDRGCQLEWHKVGSRI